MGKPALTSLRRRREECHLDFLLAKFIAELVDRTPCALADSFAELVQIIEQMDLAGCIYCNLVAARDTETRVVSGAEVHDALACCRISLFIDGAWNGKLLADTT